MKGALFLGCIAPLRYPGIESATREVLNELGVEIVDLKWFSCCPPPGVTRSFDRKTWLAIAARNLTLAEKHNLPIITICNGCYGSLFEAAHELKHNEKLREEVNKILAKVSLKYNGTTEVRHFAELLYRDIGAGKIAERSKNKLSYLKAAVHYGCHFLSPYKLKNIDNPESPKILDELVTAVGAISIPYKDKRMCCGAGGGVRARTPDVALKMTKEKLDNIKAAGAKVIINICPFCHLQYDRGQKDLGGGYNIPVLHLSQLYGLAFGLDINKLGLEAHAIPVEL